MPLPTCIKRN